MSAVATTNTPEFPWEGPIPEGDFWKDMPNNLARTIAQLFSTSELRALSLNPAFDASLPPTEKLKLICSVVEAKAAELKSTSSSSSSSGKDGRPIGYIRALYLVTQVKHELGEFEEVQGIYRGMLEEFEGDERTELSVLGGLAWNAEKMGKFEEAEGWARKNLLFLEGLEELGVDSPQALGSRRLLIVLIAKQARFEEARKMLGETRELIGKMGQGKFGKYEGEEREALDEVENQVEALEKGVK